MIVIFKMLSVIPLEYESMKIFKNVMNVDKDLKKTKLLVSISNSVQLS